jgi:DNA polymerase-4
MECHAVRKIIHIDMDAFFASVEQLDNPELRSKPVIVGGDPRGRGVVAACSYQARKFGIHSAMSCARAYKLCPRAKFVKPRKDRYQEVSRQIMTIFREYTDLVEPLSLDEAFLDLTGNNKKKIPSATWTAEAIRKEIFQRTGLTASAGVSCNKFLAKVASDINKPDGITVITPEQALPFIRTLPVRKFFGVGRVTEKRMHGMGITTGADLQRYSQQELVLFFGKAGAFFYNIVRGIDNRPVQSRRERKSIGTENTLRRDIRDRNTMLAILAEQAEQIGRSLAAKELAGRTLTLKVRYQDFTTVTRSVTPPVPLIRAAGIRERIPRLLAATEAGRQRVRLLGLSVSNLCPLAELKTTGMEQLLLPFEGVYRCPSCQDTPLLQEL